MDKELKALKRKKAPEAKYWSKSYWFLIDNDLLVKVYAKDEENAAQMVAKEFDGLAFELVTFIGELIQRGETVYDKNLLPKYNK